MGVKVKLALLILPFALFLGLLLLRSIPVFNLQTVQITVEGGTEEVPYEAKQYFASLAGASLFSINLAARIQELETITGIQ
jgi:hypothetical protein